MNISTKKFRKNKEETLGTSSIINTGQDTSFIKQHITIACMAFLCRHETMLRMFFQKVVPWNAGIRRMCDHHALLRLAIKLSHMRVMWMG
jgi:hypothetical protein